MVLQNHLTILLHKNNEVKKSVPTRGADFFYFYIKILNFEKKVAITRKNDEILEYILQKGGDTVSFLFVLSTAIILLFVLFTLYYYIAGKKEVPHHQLLEEELEREE